MPAEYLQPHWYVAQTCAQDEKRVLEQRDQRTVEAYLPLYESVRRWKDRRMRLELLLFPGYVFVHLALRDPLPVLQIPSVVRLVGFGGQPAALPDQEIEALRQGPNSLSYFGKGVESHALSSRLRTCLGIPGTR